MEASVSFIFFSTPSTRDVRLLRLVSESHLLRVAATEECLASIITCWKSSSTDVLTTLLFSYKMSGTPRNIKGYSALLLNRKLEIF